MRFLILAVGRDRSSPAADLVADYLKRCSWNVELIEIQAQRHGMMERRLAEEAKRLHQIIPADSALIALDEQGDNLTSRTLADQITRFRDRGKRSLCFVIGSADGLDRSLVEKADLRLAFGRATWPHRLVRAMLVEQIYRSNMILTGHPYHRD